jgi:hypothetical protein
MKIEMDSSENQRIKGDFVSREVYCNVDSMVRDLIECDKIREEDFFEFMGHCEELNEEITESQAQDLINKKKERIEEIEEQQDTELEAEHNNLLKEIEELEAIDFNIYPEVFEYWLVSSDLARDLKARGEVIIDQYLCDIWGRQTSGQAILLDHVISQICIDLDLLK